MVEVYFPFGSYRVARDGGLLFVFEIANNHQGSVEHGSNIIRAIARIVQPRNIIGAIKFQFRQLETFLHPGFLESQLPTSSNKHANRFIATRLNFDQYKHLAEEARKYNLIPFATPFDEASVNWCEALDFPVIKIASSVATDWPLLQRVAQAKRPVICSTAGLFLPQVDDLVTFFQERQIPIALMHCVGLYPASPQYLHMDQIRQLRERYPGVVIGYSGHESCVHLHIVALAVACGAAILERHVGLSTSTISLNAYSLAPDDVSVWVDKALEAQAAVRVGQPRVYLESEARSLEELRRGVYVKVDKKPGQLLTRDDLTLVMPCLPGQFHAGEVDKVIGLPTFERGISAMMPVMKTSGAAIPPEIRIGSIVARVREMLREAKITLPEGTAAEISHPYGLEIFERYGAVIIRMADRKCYKKLVIQLPGQQYPLHKHMQKEETYQILAGELEVEVDGIITMLQPGGSITIHRSQTHGFRSCEGMVMEEISTTDIKGDSFYIDKAIPLDPSSRKSPVVLYA
jgi:sialic acid synthase SpsE/mannose-6-phosphate isomerase-like protein (cupin superfamily)